MRAIEHLAPYLLYDVKFKYADGDTIFDLIGLSEKNGNSKGNWRVYDKHAFSHHLIKSKLPVLLLRPLSDLTKEMEQNGKKFVPAMELWSVETREEKEFEVYGTIPEYWKVAIKQIPNGMDYWIMQRLFEWHFDVFGLIEKGLAIDKNTIK